MLAVSAALRPPQTRGVYRLQRLVASCLLVSGGLLRTDALFAIIILVLPTVVVFVIRKATMVKRVAGSLATATVVLLLAIIFDQAYYLILTGQEWSDFIRFRNAAVGLLDYDRLAHLTPSQLSQVGWTINDRLMMERWWLVDPMVYSEDKLRALASFSPSKAQGIIQRVLGGNLIPRLGWFPQEHLVAIALLTAMILTLFSRTTVLATLALLTGIWGELLLVDSMGRPAPWRVAFPIFSLALAGLLISTATRGVFARYQRLQCAGIGVLFVFYVGTFIVPGVTFEAGYRARMRVEVWDAFAKVEPEKDKLFVIYGGDFPFEIAVPPFTTHRISQDIKFYWSALPAQTPFGREMLQSFNVQDVLSDLAEREDLYLVSNPGNDELVQQAFWEHYNKEVVLSPVIEHPLLRVVKIRVRGKTP